VPHSDNHSAVGFAVIGVAMRLHAPFLFPSLLPSCVAVPNFGVVSGSNQRHCKHRPVNVLDLSSSS